MGIVARVRLTFRQEGTARFLAHLDLLRAFERAARRAGLPMAYSEGFSPKPKLGFALPLSVGTSGYREYVDFELEAEMAPGEILDRLRRELPGGLIPVRVQAVARGPALMSRVQRVCYLVTGDAPEGLDEMVLQARLADFLARKELMVERKSAKGLRRKDIRPGIYSLKAYLERGKLYFSMELKAGSAGNVRPDDVLKALGSDLPLEPHNFAVLRTAILSQEGRLLWDG